MKIEKINIAIDGPSGAGKSTVATIIAEKLKYTFINSGSFYRAITYTLITNSINVKDTKSILEFLPTIDLDIKNDGSVFVNGKDVSIYIRAEQVSTNTAVVAKIHEVRDFVTQNIQKLTSNNKGFIIDGRDTTFKVMPHAEVKIFLWASPEIRASRRLEQNQEMNFESNYEEVLYAIKQRDAQDMNREFDPLHKTDDSILIDCTDMSIDKVVNTIIGLVNAKLKEINE